MTASIVLAAFLMAASPQDRVAEVAAAAEGKVGVAAEILEGKRLFSLHSHQRFPMQSVYKFPIGMATLQQVDQGKLSLDQKVRVDKSEYISPQQHSPLRDKNPNGAEVTVAELLRFAVSESDGTASDVLLRIAGGPAAVMRYLNGLGVKGLMVRDTEMRIGQDNAVQYANWATPDAAVSLLRAFHEGRGLSPASRQFLQKLMSETPTGAHRLKGLLPAGTPVAHKTGTSRTVSGITAATNDVGIITLPDGRHLAIAVFVSDSKAGDSTREEVIARIAKNAWDAALQSGK